MHPNLSILFLNNVYGESHSLIMLIYYCIYIIHFHYFLDKNHLYIISCKVIYGRKKFLSNDLFVSSEPDKKFDCYVNTAQGAKDVKHKLCMQNIVSMPDVYNLLDLVYKRF